MFKAALLIASAVAANQTNLTDTTLDVSNASIANTSVQNLTNTSADKSSDITEEEPTRFLSKNGHHGHNGWRRPFRRFGRQVRRFNNQFRRAIWHFPMFNQWRRRNPSLSFDAPQFDAYLADNYGWNPAQTGCGVEMLNPREECFLQAPQTTVVGGTVTTQVSPLRSLGRKNWWNRQLRHQMRFMRHQMRRENRLINRYNRWNKYFPAIYNLPQYQYGYPNYNAWYSGGGAERFMRESYNPNLLNQCDLNMAEGFTQCLTRARVGAAVVAF